MGYLLNTNSQMEDMFINSLCLLCISQVENMGVSRL